MCVSSAATGEQLGVSGNGLTRMTRLRTATATADGALANDTTLHCCHWQQPRRASVTTIIQRPGESSRGGIHGSRDSSVVSEAERKGRKRQGNMAFTRTGMSAIQPNGNLRTTPNVRCGAIASLRVVDGTTSYLGKASKVGAKFGRCEVQHDASSVVAA